MVVAATVNFKFEGRKTLDRFERPQAAILLAMPVIAEIPCDNSQPSVEAGSSIDFELQQPAKPVPHELLADMDKTVRGVVLIMGEREDRLVEDRTILE